MLAAACKVTVPMATAEILLDFLRTEGEVDGGGIGGGLTGTAATAACCQQKEGAGWCTRTAA